MEISRPVVCSAKRDIMPRDQSKNTYKARKEQIPAMTRSPALEAREKERAEAQASKGMQRPSRNAPTHRVRYAAEETLVRPVLPKKNLPRRGNGLNNAA